MPYSIQLFEEKIKIYVLNSELQFAKQLGLKHVYDSFQVKIIMNYSVVNFPVIKATI